MQNKSYDLFANGLDDVIADLRKYEKDLMKANDMFTERLATETVSTIQALAMSSDGVEMADIINSNVKTRLELGETSAIRVLNTSQNATYSEFGYGIVGKNASINVRPFGSDKYGATALGGWKYDMHNPPHGDKGWWYLDKFGTPKWSKGQIPRRTIYRSYLSVLGQVKSYANSVFNNIKLGG